MKEHITKGGSRSTANYILLALLLIFSTTGLAIAAPSAQEQTQTGILDVLREQGQFTTLIEALETAELVDRLRENGPFTIFAPTDEAFAKLPTDTVEDLFNNQQALTDLLLFHVVDGQIASNQIAQMNRIESLTGRFLDVNTDENTTTLNGVQIITPDLQAANGVIHVIDTVMIPQVDGAATDDPALPQGNSSADTNVTQDDTAGQIAAGCAQTYVVQAGDSLSQLAERFLSDLNAYQAIIEATNAAVASNNQFSRIDDPNIIVVGQTLCIPTSPEDIAAAGNQQMDTTTNEQITQDQVLISIPEGKSKIIFENLSSVDLVVDFSGPTPDSLIVPPGIQQEFVLDPGQYSYNGHQPGGDFSFAPGQIQLEAGEVMGLTCYDSSQCQTQEINAMLTAQEQSRPGQEIGQGTMQEGAGQGINQQQQDMNQGATQDTGQNPGQGAGQDTGQEDGS